MFIFSINLDCPQKNHTKIIKFDRPQNNHTNIFTFYDLLEYLAAIFFMVLYTKYKSKRDPAMDWQKAMSFGLGDRKPKFLESKQKTITDFDL